MLQEDFIFVSAKMSLLSKIGTIFEVLYSSAAGRACLPRSISERFPCAVQSVLFKECYICKEDYRGFFPLIILWKADQRDH